jgi:hypothetical protein
LLATRKEGKLTLHEQEVHRDSLHGERGVGNTSNQLDIFQPERDLEITAS